MRNLGVDGRRATVELTDLLRRDLAVRIGERRHARYVLGSVAPPATSPESDHLNGREAQVLALFQPGETLSRQEIEARSGLSSAMVNRVLSRLVNAGAIIATAPAKSHHRRYRLAG